MAKEAGVVKSVNGGIARALNDLTGEVRQLSVGDIVYQGEKIVTEGSNSKVTITQTDGKDITLIGKDTLTLDQDSNNNETVADISALQQAILKGTDLNALEETAAGGPQAGNAGGDGVSLGAASFAEGGHISNINANVGSIDALALAGAADNALGVSGGSAATGAGAGVLPRFSINITSSDTMEGGVMTYRLSLPTTLTSRPTTLNLNFSGGVAGVDYNANSVEYSLDGINWTRGTIVNLADANQINNLRVKVETINNYGLKGVDLANNPTQMGANQNQGEQDGSKYSDINGVQYGIYKRKLTLNVTTDNEEIANSQADGKIVDNDDYVNINQGLNGNSILTGAGEDTLNMNAGEYKNSYINLENGDDVVNIKSGATVTNTEIGVHGGKDFITLEKGATLDHARVIMGDDEDTLNINGTVKGGTHINLDNGDDILNIGEGAEISASDIQTGDSDQADKDKINIANKVTVKDWADIQGGSGDDKIEAGDDLILSNTSGIHGDWGNNGDIKNNDGDGNDKITIGKNLQMSGGSVISGGGGTDEITIGDNANISDSTIQGGAGNDKISINNGKITNSNILGDGGVMNGSQRSGNDQITISGARTELNSVNIDTGDANANAVGGAKDTVKIEDAKLKYTNIVSGNGNDDITITGNANLTGGFNRSGSGDDTITVSGNAILNNTYLQGEQGSDTITISDNVKAKGGNFNTGAGADDKIEIKDNAELDGTTLQFEGGESTDKATLNVTGNAVLKDITIQASQSLGKQYMNFHQSGEARVKSLMGSQNKDVIDIAGDFTYTNVNHLQTHGGDDEIKMHGGATVKVSVDMGDGKDTLTIDNATFKDSLVNMDGGNDEININAGANLTGTRIYTGDGNDTVNVRGGTFSEAEIGLEKGKNEVNIESGAVFGDQDARLNGFREHKTYIRSDHGNDSEDTINVKAGATVKNAEIQTYGGKDILNVDGSITNSNVDLGSGYDEVNINSGATIDNVSIKTGGGVGKVNINAGATVKKVDVTTGAENDIVNIGSDITAPATTPSATQSNINTGAGSDTVNIASGVTLTRTVIQMGAGEDTIELKGNSNTDRITFKGSTLYTDDAGYTANETDRVTITNTTFMKSDDGRLSSVITGGGSDEITVKEGTIFQDDSFIAAGTGADKIYLNSGSTFNSSRVYGDNADDNINGGNDQIYVNGAVFNGKNENGSIHGGIFAGGGDDEIFVNSGIFNDANIEGGIGNDLISIKQGVNLNNTTINGGTGDDTLKIADDTLDFSKVKNIEKLDLTEGSHNINLSAKDVLDMTDDRNKLRIDGDGNDNLALKSNGWLASGTTTADGIDYNVYTNTVGGKTVTLEVQQNQVHVDI